MIAYCHNKQCEHFNLKVKGGIPGWEYLDILVYCVKCKQPLYTVPLIEHYVVVIPVRTGFFKTK
jgi:hypothetical protein